MLYDHAMSTAVLATKLYIPPPRPNVIPRPRLLDRLNEGLHRRLTLISAPAGFGKSTLVGEWGGSIERPIAWLSLDEGDNDPARFLTYLVAALRTIAPDIGAEVLGALQSPQPPPTESILTTLLNEIADLPDDLVLVLDDYHVIDAEPVDSALTFLLEHLPPRMHLVIATREDPQLLLARLRARDQLTELRAADLRFTPAEAAGFLNQVMGLRLSPDDIAALEERTEGWIAGLQLAALSMQGQEDVPTFIQSFTGSHHFVLDYLVEEVLQRQPARVQDFLRRTSILDRMCGPLCDAVLLDPAASGQETLEYLERANLFTIPLDDERRWYRYHHLFADLLRQRLRQGATSDDTAELHTRASQWYEDNGLEIEAFQHAAAANDIERAERLIEGKGIPLHFRGAVTTILAWLGSLPRTVLDARPSLWLRYASLLLVNGQTTGVEEKLLAAENALQGTETVGQTQYFAGQIATARSVLALTRYDADAMLAQSRRALEHLPPEAQSLRSTAYWTQGFAYLLQGDRAAARRSLGEAIALGQASGNIFNSILATIGLAQVQEADTELHQAADTYKVALRMAGDQPLQIINEAHLGLSRVLYEWNELDAAEQHGRQSLHLARQYDRVIDRFILCEVFLARLKLAWGDVPGAAATLDQASRSARQHNFVHRIPDVAAAQVTVLLRQGSLEAAAQLAHAHDLPLSRARVHLALGDPSQALRVLEQLRETAEARDWKDEQLKVTVLQALAHDAHGEKDTAVETLGEALALAEPGDFIRIFLDEGPSMAQLLSEARAHTAMPGYIDKLLAAFEAEEKKSVDQAALAGAQPLIEPLSPRELEVLGLIAQGLSNSEIGERLFLALSTVKGHCREIFSKLQVQRRTEAVARARELGLL